MQFLLDFDVDYRKRRLHFMIEGQNRLYQIFDEPQFIGFDWAAVDYLVPILACQEASRDPGQIISWGPEGPR